MTTLLTHRESWADRRQQHAVGLRERADEAKRKLRNLFEAVEDGMLASTDRMFRERIAELSSLREQAEIEADRVESLANRAGPTLEMQDVIRMADTARAKLRATGSPPRHIVRTLLQRVVVASKEATRVEGSSGVLLNAIASATGNRAIMTTGAGGLNWHLAGREGMGDAYSFSVPL